MLGVFSPFRSISVPHQKWTCKGTDSCSTSCSPETHCDPNPS